MEIYEAANGKISPLDTNLCVRRRIHQNTCGNDNNYVEQKIKDLRLTLLPRLLHSLKTILKSVSDLLKFDICSVVKVL